MAAALRTKRARIIGPAGGVHVIDLRPEAVHTLVLWSKDFSNLLRNELGLADLLASYDQVYLHFTVTGLGGTALEPGVPRYQAALSQLPGLTRLAGQPRRVSVRFDPVLFWREGGSVRTNLSLFPEIASAAAAQGVKDIRTSFAQWYGKAKRRAGVRGFLLVDPPAEDKRSRAESMAETAAGLGLSLFACCQPALAGVRGLRQSSCIDGALLESLHPRREPVSRRKDRSQRPDCLCTESRDIGSYTQACPHGCVYCYANPIV